MSGNFTPFGNGAQKKAKESSASSSLKKSKVDFERLIKTAETNAQRHLTLYKTALMAEDSHTESSISLAAYHNKLYEQYTTEAANLRMACHDIERARFTASVQTAVETASAAVTESLAEKSFASARQSSWAYSRVMHQADERERVISTAMDRHSKDEVINAKKEELREVMEGQQNLELAMVIGATPQGVPASQEEAIAEDSLRKRLDLLKQM